MGTLGLLGVKHLDFWSGSTWPDSAGNYPASGWVAVEEARPSPPPKPVCPFSNCCTVDAAGAWTIRDCEGVCAPAAFWGDGTCDFRFACDALEFDDGDCRFGVADPPPPPPPSPAAQDRLPPPVPPPPSQPPPPTPTPTPPAPESFAPLPTVCVDRYENCADIVERYTCNTDLADLGNHPHELLSYACCGTCTGNGLTFQHPPEPEPEPAPSPVSDATCGAIQDTAHQGTRLDLVLAAEPSACCTLCSSRLECMAWTHVSGQCSLFSEIEATAMARRGAVSSHNLCWAGMRAVYARCCEDLGVDCSSVMPSTCSDECGSAAEMFFSHCQPFAYSHSPDTLGSVLSLCRTQPHSLPGCTEAVAINFNPSATVDDGTCIVMQAPSPPPAPPRGAFPGCPYTYCCGGDQSSGWRVNACNGECLPVAAIFDNVCDDEFNCEIYQHDRNHCERPAQTPPPSPAAGSANGSANG